MALQKVNYEAATSSYWLNLTPNELKLLTALLYRVRLGAGNDFKEAAGDLSDAISKCVGDDWMDDSSKEVDIYFSLTDEDGEIGAVIDSLFGCIEIRGGDIVATPQITTAAP